MIEQQLPTRMVYVGVTTAAAGAWTELTTSDPTCLASLMPEYPLVEMLVALPQSQVVFPSDSQEQLIKLALQARGSWKQNEPTGTSIEIVRRMREEWK
jgi:hypothetical protein